jgi:hypothetical protein
MLNQKKVEIFSRKFHKSLAKQFLEVALSKKILEIWLFPMVVVPNGVFFCPRDVL